MEKFFAKICFLSLVITLFLAMSAMSQQEASLAGYWSFDTEKGDTVNDQSGKGNDGKIKGDAKHVDGKFGKALEFTPGAYVEIPDSDTLKNMKEYSIAMWIKFKNFSADWNHLFEKDGSYGITVNSAGGDFRYTPNSGKVWAESKFKVDKNTWYYITMTADSNAVTFYANGKKQTDLKETLVFNNNVITIAHGPSQYKTDGTIDEVKFWAKSLTENEINTAMKGSSAVELSKDKLITTWCSVKAR